MVSQLGTGKPHIFFYFLGPEMASSEVSAIWAKKVDTVSFNRMPNVNFFLKADKCLGGCIVNFCLIIVFVQGGSPTPHPF